MFHLFSLLKQYVVPRLRGATAGALSAAGIFQSSNYVISLVTFPYLARTLGAEGFGVLGLGTAITAYALLLTDWGFNFTATQAASHARTDTRKLNQLLWTTIAAKAMLGAFGAIFIALTAQLAVENPSLKIVLAISAVGILGAALNVDWVLRGTEHLKQFSIASVAGRLTLIPLVYLLVHRQGDLVGAATATVLSNLITALLTLVAAWRLGFIQTPQTSWSEVRDQLSNGWLIFASTAITNAYTNSLPIILGSLCGNTQVGLFIGADRIRRPLQGIYTPIPMVFYPRINHVVKSDIAQAPRLCLSVLFIQGGLVLLIVAAAMLSAPLLVHLLLGPGFDGAVSVCRVLSGLIFFLGVHSVLGQLIMLPFGMRREYTACLTAGAIIGVSLAVPLAGTWGADGMALATLLAEALVTTSMYIILARRFSWIRIWNWSWILESHPNLEQAPPLPSSGGDRERTTTF